MRLTLELLGRTLTLSYERDQPATETPVDHLGGSFDVAGQFIPEDDPLVGRGGYDEQMGFRP